MPIADAPEWRMDPKALSHVQFHAPDMRDRLGGIMGGLESIDVEFNDRMSFAAEVLAAQVNLLADVASDHRKCLSPHRQLGHSDLVNVIVSDIMNRALMRRLRGDD